MEQINTASQPSGRIIIDFVFDTDHVQVTVIETHANPVVNQFIEAALSGIVRRWPNAVIRRALSESPTLLPSTARGRRGGPAGMPEAQKMEMVRDWFRLQGRMKQELYARKIGISASTLRRWIREMRQTGKL